MAGFSHYDAGQFGFLHIDFSDQPVPQQMAEPHTHSCWEVFCWLGGPMTYYLNEKPLRVPHSAVVAVPPGIAHKTHYETKELRWKLDIQFEDRFFNIFPSEDTRARIRAALNRGLLAVPIRWTNELRQTVINTLLPADENDALSAAKTAFAVALILTGIAETAEDMQQKEKSVGMRHSHIARAKEIIDREYASELSPKILAEKLHLTETYVCHIFRDVLGMTVSEYVRARRVHAARDMLLNSTASVAEIAEAVGFGCVNYFTKCFRAEEGVTPSRYRIIVRGKR